MADPILIPVQNQIPVGSYSGIFPDLSIATDINDNFVVVWESADSNSDIYLDLFSATGTSKLSTDLLVNDTIAGSQYNPDVAMSSNGSFVVTWATTNVPGSPAYAKLYSSQGQAISGELQIPDSNPRQPVVTMDAAGNSVVAWLSYNSQDARYLDVYAQRYDSQGKSIGDKITVAAKASDDAGAIDIGSDANGNFVVAWQSTYQDAGRGAMEIFARRFNNQGISLGDAVQVNTVTTGEQAKPRVAVDASGNFVIDWLNVAQNVTYAQKYNNQGGAVGGEFKADSRIYATDGDGTYVTTDPRYALNSNGNVVEFVTQQGAIVANRYALPPTVKFSQATYEYSEGVGRAAIELIRSGANLNVTSQVTLSTTGGTATNGVDYIDSQPVVVVTFNPGETTKRLSVQVVQDELIEPDETITLGLSNPTGTTLGTQSNSQVVLRDDDTTPSQPSGQPPSGQPPSGQPLQQPLSLLGTRSGDTLVGGSENDTLIGKGGKDTLTGGAGLDQFVFDIGTRFRRKVIGIDTITDFTSAQDKIVLDTTTFTKLKGLSFAAVKNVAQAQHSKALITYVSRTGGLYYNENGKRDGFGSGSQFADLTNGLTLTKNDFSIVR